MLRPHLLASRLVIGALVLAASAWHATVRAQATGAPAHDAAELPPPPLSDAPAQTAESLAPSTDSPPNASEPSAPAPAVRAPSEPAPDRGPTPEAAVELAGRAARMDAALAELADVGASARTWCTLWGIGGGGLTVGLGVWVASLDADDRYAPSALGAIVVSLGSMILAGGVRCVLMPITPDADRLRRWNALRSGASLDALALARFEAEVAASAASARIGRIGSGAGSLGMAVGGAIVLGLAAGGVLEDSAAGYMLGGVYLVGGALSAVLQLAGETDAERVWREYREGTASDVVRAPPGETFSLRLHGAGVAGTF